MILFFSPFYPGYPESTSADNIGIGSHTPVISVSVSDITTAEFRGKVKTESRELNEPSSIQILF